MSQEGTGRFFIGIFGIGDDIDIRMMIKEIEQSVNRDGVEFILNKC